MINTNNVYATVWEVEARGNYIKANVVTSRKDQQGEYVNSYWNGMFLGEAKKEAAKLNDKDRIHITSAGVSNEKFVGEDGKNRYYVALKIFEFEKLDGKKSESKESEKTKKSTKSKKKVPTPPVIEDDDDEDVPF